MLKNIKSYSTTPYIAVYQLYNIEGQNSPCTLDLNNRIYTTIGR